MYTKKKKCKRKESESDGSEKAYGIFSMKDFIWNIKQNKYKLLYNTNLLNKFILV